MRKRDWLLDVLIAAALAALLLSIMLLSTQIMRSKAADAQAREIASEAQARIDLYKAASTPAAERPAAVMTAPKLDVPPEPAEDWYIESIPLDKQLQKIAFDAANENGVDYLLVLAVMSKESEFDSTAVSACGCYGLMQLSPQYFPADLGDEDNIKAGTAYLGELVAQYEGDVPAALRAYNRGWDDGDRRYANAVLGAAEEIMRKAGVAVP